MKPGRGEGGRGGGGVESVTGMGDGLRAFLDVGLVSVVDNVWATGGGGGGDFGFGGGGGGLDTSFSMGFRGLISRGVGGALTSDACLLS